MVDRQRTARATPSRVGGADGPVPPVRRWTSLFASTRAAESARRPVEADVEQALADGELDVHFQRVVDRDGRPAGAEALLRWQRPGHGVVEAAAFIGLVQSPSCFARSPNWSSRELVAALPVLRSAVEAAEPYFSVNAPARQLQDRCSPAGSPPSSGPKDADAHGCGGRADRSRTRSPTGGRCGTRAKNCDRLDIALAVDDAGAEPGDLLYRDRCEAPIVKLDRTMVSESRRWAHERRGGRGDRRCCARRTAQGDRPGRRGRADAPVAPASWASTSSRGSTSADPSRSASCSVDSSGRLTIQVGGAVTNRRSNSAELAAEEQQRRWFRALPGVEVDRPGRGRTDGRPSRYVSRRRSRSRRSSRRAPACPAASGSSRTRRIGCPPAAWRTASTSHPGRRRGR